MGEDNIEGARIEQIRAAALKEEAEAKKIEFEWKKAKKEFESPFYKQLWFTKSLVAGFLLFTFLVGYAKYVFLPAQKVLEEEIDTAKFVLQQKESQFASEKARLELILAQTTQEREKAEETNKEANSQLKKANERNKQYKELLATYEASDCVDDADKARIQAEIEAITEDNKRIQELKNQTDKSLTVLHEKREEALEVAKQSTDIQGWIYLGHRPDGSWGYKTIEISANQPAKKSQKYLLIKDVNVRSQSPRFTWKGYDYGRIKGHFVAGQEIELVSEPREVGFSKIWAEAKLHNEN